MKTKRADELFILNSRRNSYPGGFRAMSVMLNSEANDNVQPSDPFAFKGTPANTTETSLFSFTINKRFNPQVFKGLRIRGVIEYADNANNKQAILYIGSDIAIYFTPNLQNRFVMFEVYAHNYNDEEGFITVKEDVYDIDTGLLSAAETNAQPPDLFADVFNEATDNVIELTGTNGTASAFDIAKKSVIIELI